MSLPETLRTRLREMTVSDATFIRRLLNEPSFLRFIGDRQVRTDDDAATFIETRYRASYRDNGYGLYVVEHRVTMEAMGICGFVRRDGLSHPDIGFAFLQEYEGSGYAFEAATAALEHAAATLGFTRVLAIAQRDNARSHILLERLGFCTSGDVLMPGESVPVALYTCELSVPQRPPSPGTRPAS